MGELFHKKIGKGFLPESHSEYDYYDAAEIVARQGGPIPLDRVPMDAFRSALSRGEFSPKSTWALNVIVGVHDDPLGLRRKGTGSFLVQDMVSWAKGKGSPIILGEFSPNGAISNQATERFWEKNGFKIFDKYGYCYVKKEL